jgi:hypothetical protein
LLCDLGGAFLLAIPMLFGVDNSLRFLLSARSRLRARSRLLARSSRLRHFRHLTNFRWRGFVIGSDIKPGEINLNAFVLVLPGVALLALGYWHHLGGLTSAITAPYRAIEVFTWWLRYPFWLLILGLQIFLSIPLFLMTGLFLSLAFGLALIAAATLLAGLLKVTAALIGIPACILYWVVRQKQEREKKLGWVGFSLLVVAFFIQAKVNLMP